MNRRPSTALVPLAMAALLVVAGCDLVRPSATFAPGRDVWIPPNGQPLEKQSDSDLRIVLYEDGTVVWKEPDPGGSLLATQFEGTWEGEFDKPGEPLTLRKKVTGDAQNWTCEQPGLYVETHKIHGGRRILYWKRVH
jgi:hypothetical protein